MALRINLLLHIVSHALTIGVLCFATALGLSLIYFFSLLLALVTNSDLGSPIAYPAWLVISVGYVGATSLVIGMPTIALTHWIRRKAGISLWRAGLIQLLVALGWAGIITRQLSLTWVGFAMWSVISGVQLLTYGFIFLASQAILSKVSKWFEKAVSAGRKSL